ncbi:MAG: DUF1080 domain-containing protein [Planctomycetaceae bacterium]|nr:DUF1080 domain-containing protein [Planctomycetaceae bacterium]
MRKLIMAALLATLAHSNLCCAKGPAYDTEKTASDVPTFAIQGEYVAKGKGIQVIARGGDKCEVVEFEGGLPGAGWTGSDRKRTELSLAETKNFVKDLEKVDRKSPTLGAKPPESAIVLFDGTSETAQDHWVDAKLTDNGLLKEGVRSKETFRDFHLHMEFKLPFMPDDQEQARGNSGCYLQGRYEVQLLDSFGLEGLDNECGGIYKAAAPNVNMCFPPLSWQTYDIVFTAARFNDAGIKTNNAQVTVKHNGVVIHENLELPTNTPGGVLNGEADTPGPIFLQNHGDPVRFRNIWVVPKE